VRPGERTRSPIVEVLADYRLLLLRLAGVSMFNAVAFYVMFV
jgi:hypothetical protein